VGLRGVVEVVAEARVADHLEREVSRGSRDFDQFVRLRFL